MGVLLKPVRLQAAYTLDILTSGLNQPGDAKKIDSDKGFMAVHVECINAIADALRGQPGKFFSVAHYGQQNGDAMRDPDVVFLQLPMLDSPRHSYIPVSFRNDYLNIYREFCQYDERGKIITAIPPKIADCASFCGTWMNNIRHQQNLENPAFSMIKAG